MPSQFSLYYFLCHRIPEDKKGSLYSASCVFAVVPVTTSVSTDETEALKAEITKAVEKVQEAGRTAQTSRQIMQCSSLVISMLQKVT